MKALALLALAAATPAQQFDLVCSGETTAIEVGGKAVSSYSRRIRVDLEAKQWCADSCRQVDPIAKLEPGRIVFRDVTIDTAREYWKERESVNRVTGEHSSMATNAPPGGVGRAAFSEGHCERAAFSGLVSGKVRF